MLARSLVLLFVSVLMAGRAVAAAEPATIAGTWEGSLVLGDAGLRLLFNFTIDANGRLDGTMDSPDQGAYGIALDSVALADNVLRCEVRRISGVYEGTFDPAKRTVVGQWQQGGRSFALTLRPATPVKLKRPQEPKPPYPYAEEEVSYRNSADGVQLAGTFTKPKRLGRFPAVLLLSGSGPQDRNEELMGHKPFLVLADDLTRRGIAVLRVDDRGVGGSTGSRDAATSEDFAADALAGVAYLKARVDVDSRRIGLIGHSEGALVAAMAAAKSKDVAFIAMLAGPGVKGTELLLLQASLVSEITGVSAGLRAFNRETQQRMFAIVQEEKSQQAARAKLAALWEERKKDAAASTTLGDQEKRFIAAGDATMRSQLDIMTSPWMRHFLGYDPAATLKRVRVPVLAINGLIDLQVPARQNLPAIEAALKAGGNTNVRIVELRDLNHLFQKATTGSPAEYGTIEETMNPQALSMIGEWVVAQTR
jgi:pimeloyl-ACP methyl ester carboxylesterase